MWYFVLFVFFDEIGFAMYPTLALNSQHSSCLSFLRVRDLRALGSGFVCKNEKDLYAQKDKVFFLKSFQVFEIFLWPLEL